MTAHGMYQGEFPPLISASRTMDRAPKGTPGKRARCLKGDPMIDDTERRPVKSATKARQGVTGHNVRYVLFWGTLLAVIAMVAVYFFLLHGRV